MHDGELPKADRIVSVIQLASAAAVAVIVTVPVCWPRRKVSSTGPVTPVPPSLAWSVTWSPAALHAAGSAVVFGLGVPVAAFAAAALKHSLAGH